MSAADDDVLDRVRGIVVAAVAREMQLTQDRIDLDYAVDNPACFYRILVDIEGRLDLNALEGNWTFEGNSVGAIVAYYVDLLDRIGEDDA